MLTLFQKADRGLSVSEQVRGLGGDMGQCRPHVQRLQGKSAEQALDLSVRFA